MLQARYIDIVTRKRDHNTRRLARVGAALLLSGGLWTFARAADLDGQGGLKDPLAVGDSQDWSRFDPYRLRGWNVPLPGPQGTVTGDAGGLRDVLASYGIGWLGFGSDQYITNAASHGTPLPQTLANQQYIGQLPSYITVNSLYLTYDLSRVGLPGGQVVAGGSYFNSSVENIFGRDEFTMSALYYYQSLFNKAVEIQVGYIPGSVEYYGAFIAGSLLGGVFGPNALVPAEAGIGATQFPTLGGNVQINLPNHFYTKLGIERAISPDGATVDIKENDYGFATNVAHAGIEYIGEVGYKQRPEPGVMGTWVRGTFTYNTSDYRKINSSGIVQNVLFPPPLGGTIREKGEDGAFLLADRQIWQSPSVPYDGIYIGGSYYYSPSDLNVFNKYYEARAYWVGPIPGHPNDLLDFVFADQIFSPELVSWASQPVVEKLTSLKTHGDSKTYAVNYSYELTPGWHFNLGVQYTDNPTVVTYAPTALPPTHLGPVTLPGSTAATGSALTVSVGTAYFF